jgi:hypothetical protein
MRPSGPYEPAARGRVGRRRKVAQILNTGKRLQRPCARASRAIDPISRGMLLIHLCARPWEARCSCGVKWSRGRGVAQIRATPGLGHLVLVTIILNPVLAVPTFTFRASTLLAASRSSNQPHQQNCTHARGPARKRTRISKTIQATHYVLCWSPMLVGRCRWWGGRMRARTACQSALPLIYPGYTTARLARSPINLQPESEP